MGKVIVILFLFLSLDSSAQEFTYFSKEIEIEGSHTTGTATIPFDNGYYTVGNYSVNDGPGIYFLESDLEGNMVDYHILEISSPSYSGLSTGEQFIQTQDGHFVLVYLKKHESIDGKEDIVLLKFSKNGEILWKRQYGGEGKDTGREVIQTKDGGFFIAGQLNVNDVNEMYAIKTNALGIVEWESSFCFYLDCRALSVAESEDGGYVIGGYTKIPNFTYNYNLFFAKIDSLGNLEWDKNYGSEYAEAGCYVYTLPDGNYLIRGGIHDENEVNRNYYAKVSKSGEIIWEKFYKLPRLKTMQAPIVLKEDGGFIGVALVTSAQHLPMVMNFNAEGDTLWTALLKPDEPVDFYVRDMDKIDGGYVLTGTLGTFQPYYQRSWLVTIDEVGNFCEEIGCIETIVDIEEEIANKKINLQVIPNPVSKQALFRYQISKNGILKIYDYKGIMISYWQLENDNSSLILELEDWVSGVYWYSVEIDGKKLRGGKFIVEN